ncbi:aryl-alcohol dehydrogenase-like predicted oxidoreductase [Scopulibacillus daqui]|uniref:Aryl-alcohol dehydrogenase-like predicted oxidoreductase n=1 Tax=Scopulibacillus daqui TaxID=1469162 RepID=A0ABS2Q1R7_9BACL|nr:aldo/keto reductase [Scopulibacillus daqui]MBM7646218.1 aryl-alcohol dehydrogenase-like predicted oxidoreductase [Scopulibacillus daqui]
MKKNQLGTSDLYVSEIGYGTMSLPKSERNAVYLVNKAIDEGVNFFDTADLYDYGRIEEVLGKAIKGKRDQIILATKAGNHWEPGKEGWFWDPSKAYIKEAVKKSCQRLNTDYIDLFQLHGGTIEDPIDETIEAFEELVQEGIIRYYGISSIRPNVIREYVKKSSIVSVMMQYSILDRRPEEEMLDFLKENNVSVIARGPVGKGILSDNGLNKIPEKGYLDYTSEECRTLVAQLKEKTNSARLLSHTAIRYVLAHPAVAATIPGASREEQLISNLQAADSPDLSDQEIQMIKELSKANQYKQHR